MFHFGHTYIVKFHVVYMNIPMELKDGIEERLVMNTMSILNCRQ